jgi:hypothetical protein
MLNRRSAVSRYFISLLFLSGTVVSALAAPKLPPKGKDLSKAATTGKDVAKSNATSFQPFSLDMLNAGRISPQYTGVPVDAAITAIEKLTQLKKGEFESTTEFQTRQKAAVESNFLGNLKLTDILPFVIDVQKKSYDVPLYYSYNADKAEVSLTDRAEPKKYNGIGGISNFSAFNMPSYYTFKLSKDFDKKETYSASNAYGAIMTVEKLGVTEYGVATDNSTSFSMANLPMESSRAASELPSLKALILVKPKEPYLIHDFSHIEPTRDSPIELTVRTKSLIGDVMAIVFFSGRTGEIIAKTPGLTLATESVAETR